MGGRAQHAKAGDTPAFADLKEQGRREKRALIEAASDPVDSLRHMVAA